MKSIMKKAISYGLIGLLGLIMVYPLLWLVSSSFKTNEEIFTSFSLIPSSFSLKAYIQGWQGIGDLNYSKYFMNTFKMVIPSVTFTLISSYLVAYGFARFRFPFKKLLFSLMISTLMLPKTVIIIPRYMLFRDLGWLDSYLPFYLRNHFLFLC